MAEEENVIEFPEPRGKIDHHVMRQGGEHLFGKKGMTESQALETRSNVVAKGEAMSILYYAFLQEAYGSNIAGIIKDEFLRLSHSIKGLSREQAVRVLESNISIPRTLRYGKPET